MNNVRHIRTRLGLSQAEFAAAIGVTQGNVSHIERGQEVMPAVARGIIAAAAKRGVTVTFDDIYGAGAREEPSPPSRPRPLPSNPTGQGAPQNVEAAPSAGCGMTAAVRDRAVQSPQEAA